LGSIIGFKESGYWHVPIKEEDRKWLGFEFAGNYFHWNVLPFGWNLAPFVFTRITRSMEALIQSMGINNFWMLDDCLIYGKKGEEWKFEEAKKLLKSLGWRINEEKIQVPSKEITFLGYRFNCGNKMIRVGTKMEESIKKILDLKEVLVLTKRKWYSLIGIIGAGWFISREIFAFTIELMESLEAISWENLAKRRLNVKKVIPDILEGRRFRQEKSKIRRVVSDAADFLGIKEGPVGHFMKAPDWWTINEKEFMAGVWAVSRASPGERVILSTDSQVVFWWMKKKTAGNRNVRLVLSGMTKWMKRQRIWLSVRWLPTYKNLADILTREPFKLSHLCHNHKAMTDIPS